ncbi:MAG TPA: hypothetical protein VE130_05730 [Nitrososphaeraceae archaeon]|nr:hypothetical protein [Nitrososphaeraceae archaeon]
MAIIVVVALPASAVSATSTSASSSDGQQGYDAIAYWKDIVVTVIINATVPTTNTIPNILELIMGKRKNARILKSIAFAITEK